MSGRKLWARSQWEVLQPIVEAHQKAEKLHALTAYNEITRAQFGGLEGTEQAIWNAEAKAMNEGKGSPESRALYGDLVYTEFINNVLFSAQKWFGAHMIIISSRPSIVLETEHANSIKETRPLHTWQRTFLQKYKNSFVWNVKDYPPWTVRMDDPNSYDPVDTYITFDPNGEPLMPLIKKYKLAKDRAKAVQIYFTTHCCMAACNPSATPAYIDFPLNAALYLEDKFFPPEALPDKKALYLQKPGQMGAERILHWMIHILARQERYLAGEEGVLPFRWLCYKDGDKIVDARYTQGWMMAYTNDLRLPPIAPALPTPPADAPTTSTTAQPPPLPAHGDPVDTATTNVPSRRSQPTRNAKSSRTVAEEDSGESDADQVEQMMGAGNDEEYRDDEEEDLPLSAIRDHGSEDEKDNSDYEDGEDHDDDEFHGEVLDTEGEKDNTDRRSVGWGGKTARLDKGKGVLRPARKVTFGTGAGSSPVNPSPGSGEVQNETFSQRMGNLLDSLDLIIEHLGEDGASSVPIIAPPFVVPSWVSNDICRKGPFLRALSTNEHYQALVDYYSAQKISVSLPHTSFPWLDWSSESVDLPAEYHQVKARLRDMLRYLNDWNRNPASVFRNGSELEAHLLFAGILHRDMHGVSFDHDVSDGNRLKPGYFDGSQLDMQMFDVLNASLMHWTVA
ncbi:hypothetical protein QCA50_016993 [Cerrena zonata]|uniref:Uncharacterized protein n=1 Tax=Cerrena zonata TaxID=2478898 RepID=A0AAW0FIG9_9APHY